MQFSEFSKVDKRNTQTAVSMVGTLLSYFKHELPSTSHNNRMKRELSGWQQRHERYLQSDMPESEPESHEAENSGKATPPQ